MKRKKKGSKGEHAVMDIFILHGYGVVRAAGSGTSQYPSPDLVAGKILKYENRSARITLGIEVKTKEAEKVYIEKKQINELKQFCETFGATPLVIVKMKKDWGVFALSMLRETEKSWVADKALENIYTPEDFIEQTESTEMACLKD